MSNMDAADSLTDSRDPAGICKLTDSDIFIPAYARLFPSWFSLKQLNLVVNSAFHANKQW